MPYTRKKYRIPSTRLQDWNYQDTAYYSITICTKDREKLFGQVKNGSMELNEYGRILEACWKDLPNHYDNLVLDEHVIMPEHFHGIMLVLSFPDPELPWHGLPEFVRALKTFSSRRINEKRGTPGRKIWQQRYYEHIIRTRDELIRWRVYIRNNPVNLRKYHKGQQILNKKQ